MRLIFSYTVYREAALSVEQEAVCWVDEAISSVTLGRKGEAKAVSWHNSLHERLHEALPVSHQSVVVLFTTLVQVAAS